MMKTFRTFDGLNIRFSLFRCSAHNSRGWIVLLGGRSEFIEKYAETVDELLARQYDVATMDWRGQGLSDRMLANRFKGYVKTYDDYLGDLACFMDRYVTPRKARSIIVLAHSMGAHIALRYLHAFPGRVDKVVLTSPLIDIAGSAVFKRVARAITELAVRLGLQKRYATRVKDFDPFKNEFRGNRLTRDRIRFQKTFQMVTDNPELAIGGVTFGWLRATFASIDRLNAAGFAEKITTPLLMVAAGSDRVVSLTAQKSFCRCVPDCRMKTIPEAFHEIFIEVDPVRQAFWEAFDPFVSGESEG